MPKSSGRPGGVSRLYTVPLSLGRTTLIGGAASRTASSSVVPTSLPDGQPFGFVLNCATVHVGRATGLAAKPGGTSTRILRRGFPSGTLLLSWFSSNRVTPHGGRPAACVKNLFAGLA